MAARVARSVSSAVGATRTLAKPYVYPHSERRAQDALARERDGRIGALAHRYAVLYAVHGTGEAIVPRRSTARLLVWFALAGQVAFIAAWVVAGALEPRYSAVDQAVSELGA